MHFDKLLLGVNGVSERGISVNNFTEAGVKRMMVSRATQVIALADSSKIGVHSLVHLEPLDAVNMLITDRGTTDAQIRRLRKTHPGLEVLRA